MLRIEKIKQDDIDKLIELYRERYFWLKSKKLDMWKMEQLNEESLTRQYEKPEYFLAYADDQRIGGFILIEKDIRYWPDNIADKAYYFHKFVIGLNHKGKGYSGQVLELVKEYGRKNGKDYIRLDYEKERGYLATLYTSHGFRAVRSVVSENGKEMILGECRL